MNHTLQDFSLAITEEIEITVKNRLKLQKYWPEEILIRSLDYKNITICKQLIYLFIGIFPSLQINDNEVRKLAIAGQMFADSLVVSDNTMDRRSMELIRANVLSIQGMQFESYHLLTQIFPPDATFWRRFRDYLSKYTQACLEEYDFSSGKRPWKKYTESTAIQIIKDKTGVAKTALAGLAELAQDDTYLQPLEDSLSNVYVANQMLDDLLDWKEDLLTGMPSLLLSRLINESSRNKSSKELEKLSQNLGHEIYYQGHAHYLLELSLRFLDRAEIVKNELPQLFWWQITAKLRHKCQTLIQDIGTIIHKNLERVQKQPKFNLTLPPNQSRWQKLAWDGLYFIVKQWQLGFGEARHIMEFSQEQGFSNEQEYHYGDVFQRALIADTLCDFYQVLGSLIQPILDSEVNYILSCQRKSGIGAWSYFPDLSEQPPDADDLAQIMQVLLRSGYESEIKKSCEIPLQVLLEDNYYPDGSFETWIIPNCDRTEEQQQEAKWVKKAWGSGPDNEVIANLLYALWLYKPQLFSSQIERGITYLETQQQTAGSWLSGWYHGPYYGTYVCLRLLTSAKSNSSAIPQALNFLKTHQLEDGGWALEGKSDPLNTALSLLGLSYLEQEILIEHNIYDLAAKALTYLENCQQQDRAWKNCLFIRMELGRAKGKVDQILSYGSRTLTTTFVMKACIAWHQLINVSSTNLEPKSLFLGV